MPICTTRYFMLQLKILGNTPLKINMELAKEIHLKTNYFHVLCQTNLWGCRRGNEMLTHDASKKQEGIFQPIQLWDAHLLGLQCRSHLVVDLLWIRYPLPSVLPKCKCPWHDWVLGVLHHLRASINMEPGHLTNIFLLIMGTSLRIQSFSQSKNPSPKPADGSVACVRRRRVDGPGGTHPAAGEDLCRELVYRPGAHVLRHEQLCLHVEMVSVREHDGKQGI